MEENVGGGGFGVDPSTPRPDLSWTLGESRWGETRPTVMSKAWQFIGQQGAQQADERSPPLPENQSLGSLITTIALAASQSWHAEKKSGWSLLCQIITTRWVEKKKAKKKTSLVNMIDCRVKSEKKKKNLSHVCFTLRQAREETIFSPSLECVGACPWVNTAKDSTARTNNPPQAEQRGTPWTS